MSRVFIAWSGNRPLAKALTDYILGKPLKLIDREFNEWRASDVPEGEAETPSDAKPPYHFIIGGNLQGQHNNYVWQSIEHQIRQCDQAILLVEKKTGEDDTGESVSPNLLFEWGYLMAKFPPEKIHVFLLQMETSDPCIPADLRGIWAEEIKDLPTDEEKTNRIFVDLRTSDSEKKTPRSRIALEHLQKMRDTFLARQNMTVPENKMDMIMEWYKSKSFIRSHTTDAMCSDNELAQYVLSYIYSAHIFTDISREAKQDIEILNELLKRKCSDELRLALRGARNTFALFDCIHHKDDAVYIECTDYNRLILIYEILISCIREKLPESELSHLMLAFYYNFIAYADLLMIDSPGIEEKKRNECCTDLIRVSEIVIRECAYLEQQNKESNDQLCWLLRAYMYRGIFFAMQTLEAAGQSPVKSPYTLRDCLKYSLDSRTLLYEYYKGEHVNAVFMNTLEMEYCLALVEYYSHESNQEGLKENWNTVTRSITAYVEKSKHETSERMVFVNRIKNYADYLNDPKLRDALRSIGTSSEETAGSET